MIAVMVKPRLSDALNHFDTVALKITHYFEAFDTVKIVTSVGCF